MVIGQNTVKKSMQSDEEAQLEYIALIVAELVTVSPALELIERDRICWARATRRAVVTACPARFFATASKRHSQRSLFPGLLAPEALEQFSAQTARRHQALVHSVRPLPVFKALSHYERVVQ